MHYKQISYASILHRFLLQKAALCAIILFAGELCGSTDFTLILDGLPQSDLSAAHFSHSIETTPTGPVIHRELKVVKPVDAASPLLMEHLCKTQAISRIQLTVFETGEHTNHFYRITMRDVLVSSYFFTSLEPDSTPTEEVSFNYTEIAWTYILTISDGTGRSAESTYWDRENNIGGIFDPDTDGDGIPDSYEVQEMLKPLQDDATEDNDNDGMSNKDEHDAGTLAGDPDSIFKITALITPGEEGLTYTVTFNSVAGRSYEIHTAASLTGPWLPAHTVVASGPVTSIDLTLPLPASFVKVVVQPL